MTIRSGRVEDVDILSKLEGTCFPIAEAATRKQFEARLNNYASHFYLLFEGGRLISFIDGLVTDEENLRDEMYEKADMHNENGAWQMVFGLNTHPDFRNKGYAGTLVKHMIKMAKEEGRKGLVLTAKEPLVPYYESFGFVNEGLSSESTHGGVSWYQLRLSF